MKKIIVLLINILLVLVLCSCGNYKKINTDSLSQDSEKVSSDGLSTENYYDSYFESIVEAYNEQLNWSILMVDVENQEILGQYGDTERLFEPGSIIKPAIYASFIEYGNIDLESIIDNTPITYGNNEYRSMNINEPSSTILDSFKSLSNTAIVRLWESAQSNPTFLDSIAGYGLMPQNDTLASLFGYQTSTSLKECINIYSELVKKDTDVWSQNTKDTINNILSYSFNEITNFQTNTDWMPYGVYETVSYPEKTGIDTNFAGYLTLEGKGVILVINVHDENNNFYSAKDLSEAVANIFYSYISQS